MVWFRAASRSHIILLACRLCRRYTKTASHRPRAQRPDCLFLSCQVFVIIWRLALLRHPSIQFHICRRRISTFAKLLAVNDNGGIGIVENIMHFIGNIAVVTSRELDARENMPPMFHIFSRLRVKTTLSPMVAPFSSKATDYWTRLISVHGFRDLHVPAPNSSGRTGIIVSRISPKFHAISFPPACVDKGE